MQEDQRCRLCGTLLAPDEETQICMVCALAQHANEAPSAQFTVRNTKAQGGDGTTRDRFEEDSKLMVDRYRLVRKIGEGGFGVVYAAEQLDPIRRKIAIKIVKAGLGADELLARFDAERQALALMEHTNVARVLDAGQMKDGRPFFVMELVRGEPLTRYCLRHRPNLKELVELFVHVCHGVAHAHERGIIHRDLKPSNILVEGEGSSAVPKIIDFGIAKATGSLLTEKTILTRPGQLLGTIQYMSPEQALSDGLDVDVRSDVYSLGAVLYELLCGAPPVPQMPREQFRLDVMLDHIRDETATRPSAATEERTSTFTADGTNLGRARDLDWIVLKALDKERSRRYPSAEAFAGDLSAFLEGRPVTARRPSLSYRTGRFLQRNRKGTAAVLAVILILLVSLVVVHLRSENLRIETLATRFLDASPESARDLVDGVKAHPGPTSKVFSNTVGIRGKLGLALTGKYSWSGLLEESQGQPRGEIELILSACPRSEASRFAEASRKLLADDSAPPTHRLGAALTLCHVDPSDSRWDEHLRPLARLLRNDRHGADWAGGFRALADKLVPHFLDHIAEVPDDELSRLASTLGAITPDLAPWIIDQASTPPRGNELERDAHARARAKLGATLLHTDLHRLAWPLLERSEGMSDPRQRHYLIHGLVSAEVDPVRIATWAQNAGTPLHARVALLRALGDFEQSALPRKQRELLVSSLKRELAEHPSVSIHSECARLLAIWGYESSVEAIEKKVVSSAPRTVEHEWYIDSSGHAFATFPANLSFSVARTDDDEALESDDDENEIDHLVPRTLRYPFALGIRPVTLGQFKRCRKAMEMMAPEIPLDQFIPNDRCPVVHVTEQMSMLYSNWLSGRHGIPPEQFCYVPAGNSVRPADDFVKRTGYRICTEDEWEFACRAWSTTSYPWGNDPALYRHYSKFTGGVGTVRLEPVLMRAPNDLGFMGCLGNVSQRCHRTGGDWIRRGASQGANPIFGRSSRRDPPDPLLGIVTGIRLARTLSD